jgi:YVTN family beta-propeller protein
MLFVLLGCGNAVDTSHLEKDLLHLEAKIALPGVSGRIDHLAYDPAGQRVFVAALGNNTVEVIDLGTRVRVHTITGLHEPQGVRYVAGLDRLVVANGSNGACTFYDGKSYAEIGQVVLAGDADNMRDDGKLVYVGYGSGNSSGIAIIDPAAMKQVGNLSLNGHPESFQLGDSGRVYINVPDNGEIVTGDLNTRLITGHWNNSGASANFPMALTGIPTPPTSRPTPTSRPIPASPPTPPTHEDRHLFVAYRHPAVLRTLDAGTGSVLASLPCVGDADDVFYAAPLGLVFVSGGEGYLDVFRGGVLANHLATRRGARTGLWLPREKKFILAVPKRGGEDAALWVYGLM